MSDILLTLDAAIEFYDSDHNTMRIEVLQQARDEIAKLREQLYNLRHDAEEAARCVIVQRELIASLRDELKSVALLQPKGEQP